MCTDFHKSFQDFQPPRLCSSIEVEAAQSNLDASQGSQATSKFQCFPKAKKISSVLFYLGMNSDVKAITKEFTHTATQLIVRRINSHTPIPCARSATGLRKFTKKLIASMRSSTMLLMSANNGASGKAATNIVTKPNWMTES